MNVRCSLGWHSWKPWREYTEVTHHVVFEQITNRRRPDEDFDTSRAMQRRSCARCGLTEKKRL